MEGKVYAQVYSLIRVERDGLIEALKELSRIGYDGVEIISDNSGGLSIDEFKALLQELKLDVIAIHGWGSDDEINMAKACGIRYLAFDAKLEDYRNAGIILGDRLILTFDRNGLIDMGMIEATIKYEVIPRL